jgi:hypothetical protein
MRAPAHADVAAQGPMHAMVAILPILLMALLLVVGWAGRTLAPPARRSFSSGRARGEIEEEPPFLEVRWRPEP